MDGRNDRRQAAVTVAATVLLATLIMLGLNALFGPEDPFDDIERLEARLAERGAAVEALTAEVGGLRAELAEVREAAAAAREQASQALEVAVARRRVLEEVLAAARQPPRITVVAPEPEEPDVTVLPAEPQVAVEAVEPLIPVVPTPGQRATAPGMPGGRPAPEAAVAPGAGEGMVAAAGVPRPPSPLALRAGELIGAAVVNRRGERIAEVTDIVREPVGDRLYAVLEVGGVIREVVGALPTREVAVPLDQLEPGPAEDEVVLTGLSEQEFDGLPAYDGAAFEPLPR